MLVDCAIYADGLRLDAPVDIASLRLLDERPDAFAWIGFNMPLAEELTPVLAALGGAGDLTVDEILAPHRRPVLSLDGPVIQLVLRTARYVDRDETISLGELIVLVWERAIVSLRFGHASPLSALRHEVETDPERLRLGPLEVLSEIVDQVIADYSPALDGFEQDVLEVERDVFTDRGPQPVRRLYALKREVRRFQSPLEALDEPLTRLLRYARRHADHETFQDLTEASDQLARTIQRTRSLSNLLDAALTATLAQTGIQQNADMRRISAWVAMAAVPTLVAGVYGMNFDHMPELGSRFGYPVVLLAMGVTVLALYRYFKRNGWL